MKGSAPAGFSSGRSAVANSTKSSSGPGGGIERGGFSGGPDARFSSRGLAAYGPKLEAGNRFSPDTRNRHVSAFKTITSIYESKADTKYHADPNHSPIHTGPVRNERGDTRQNNNRPPKMREIFVRPATQEKKTAMKPTHNNEIRQTPVPPKSDLDRLLPQTRALRPGERVHQEPVRTSSKTSLYERSRPRVTPDQNHISIAQSGEMRITKGKIDSGAAQQMLKNKSARQATEVPSQVQKNKQQTEVRQEAKQVQQQKFDKFMQKSRILEVRNPHQVEAQVVEALRSESAPKVSLETGQVKTTTENRQSIGPRQVQKAVTAADTQSLLAEYQKEYLFQAPATQQPNRSERLTSLITTHPEITADLKVAAKINALAVELRPEDAQEIVLKALDQKFEKTHLKEQLRTQTLPQVETPVPVTYEETQPEIDKVPLTTTTLQSDEQLAPLPVVQERTNQTPVPVESLQEAESEEAVEMVTQPKTNQVTATPQLQTQPEEQMTEAELAEETLQQTRILLKDAYERDDLLDDMRYRLAMSAAAQAFEASQGEAISGEVFLYAFQHNYADLTSVILPEDMPDDYLTDIIEKLAMRKYRSISEAETSIRKLIMQRPAITYGELQDVPESDVEAVKNSMHFPRNIT